MSCALEQIATAATKIAAIGRRMISSAGLETVPLYHSGIVLVDKNGVIDQAVEVVGLHHDGRAHLAAHPVAVRPVHEDDFPALHVFFRYTS